MPPSEQARWFAEEVQPHERALRAYLTTRFPSVPDHDDVVQETYSRLLAAKASGDVRHARAFLFTTARNAALDLFRRRQRNPMETVNDVHELHVLEERPDVAAMVSRQQELAALAEAVADLPDRCREVVMLRYVEGLAYREIAERLEISPETVKVHLAKAMRRCTEFLARRGFMGEEGAG